MISDSNVYKAIGLMSGTSLDGLDIAYCEFQIVKEKWNFQILHAETIDYPDILKDKLCTAYAMTGLELSFLNIELGEFFGNASMQFITKYNLKPDFISSHGHTVFHQPHKKLTLQIGSGAEIASISGIKTVCDFRTQDVALGGQGAPLVPIGDKLLFSEYDACINLGGFANISYELNGKMLAFDVCPFNIVPNFYLQKQGKLYDDKGKFGKSGILNKKLYDEWGSLEYYKKLAPKSLGWEFIESDILSKLNSELKHSSILKTYYEHIADQLSEVINSNKFKNILLTGGGVYNTYVVDLISSKTESKFLIPDETLVNYKEALVFAFMGLLRLKNESNILKSVTGAKYDHCSGVTY